MYHDHKEQTRRVEHLHALDFPSFRKLEAAVSEKQ